VLVNESRQMEKTSKDSVNMICAEKMHRSKQRKKIKEASG